MFKFIIIDDELLIRKGTLEKLKKLNLNIECVGEASNGMEAIQYLDTKSIDFIITDMDMPELDGVGLLDFLQTKRPKMPIIVISGYQNFSYLQKSIQAKAADYILKPFNKEILEKAVLKVLNELDNYQLTTEHENEVILTAFIGNTTKLAKSAFDKRIKNAKAPRLALTNQIPSAYILQESYYYSKIEPNNQYLLILENDLIKNLSFTSNKFYMGISEPITDQFEIQKYYLQAIQSLNARKYQSPQIVYFRDQRLDVPFEFPKLPELIYYLETGNARKFTEIFQENMKNMFYHNKATIYNIKQIGFLSIEKTKIFLDELYHTDSNYTLPEVYQKVNQTLFDFDQILDYFTEFLTNIAKSLAHEALYSSDDIIQNVQSYIQLHYRDTITLDILAETFFINPTYLSSRFKEKTGMKYIDYLNKQRIKKAKILLKTTNLKVSIISHKVGYENEKYFYRVFKKFVKMTPEHYRHNN